MSPSVRVEWFAQDGQLRRELTGSSMSAQPGFIYAYGEGQPQKIYATNGNWEIELPKKDGPTGYVTGTPDSRAFLHEFHPKEGEIAADLYVAGKLAKTIGPFTQYEAHDFALGDDGSLAVMIWKDQTKKTAQVVVTDPAGVETFRVECEGRVLTPIPAPGGVAALIQANGGGPDANRFTLYTAAGNGASMQVGPNAHFIAWVPGTTTAVMSTSIGYDHRFHLIDWATGKLPWDVVDPNGARVPWGSMSVAIEKDLVLITGLQYVPAGEQPETVRTIHALDLKTGKLIAQWLPSPANRRATDAGTLLHVGDQLYLIAGDGFSLIRPAEIREHVNGWK